MRSASINGVSARRGVALQQTVSSKHIKNSERRSLLVVRATGNTFGNAFRVTTFGESHGGGVGCVVDGVPPRLRISQVVHCGSCCDLACIMFLSICCFCSHFSGGNPV